MRLSRGQGVERARFALRRRCFSPNENLAGGDRWLAVAPLRHVDRYRLAINTIRLLMPIAMEISIELLVMVVPMAFPQLSIGGPTSSARRLG